jgi:ABC-type dipeptide/oligopeptide/nickel transport system permease subunit
VNARRANARVACLVLLLLAAATAVCGPAFAPYDPALPSGPPLAPPGPGHLLGTNDVGQDVFSGWLWAGRASLAVGAAVALISTALAWTVGIAAGLSRRAEWLLMPLADLLLALPPLPLYMLVVALAGPSQTSLVLTLGLLSWPAFARVVRAEVLALRAQAFVEAARALGAGPWRIARTHLLPATLALLPAKLVVTVRLALLGEATLAFLGLGDPTVNSWGTMLGWAFNDPLLFDRGAWAWWAGPPALSIALAVLGTTWLAGRLGTAEAMGGWSVDRPVEEASLPRGVGADRVGEPRRDRAPTGLGAATSSPQG